VIRVANQVGGRNDVVWPVADETDWIMRWRMVRRSTRQPLNLADYQFYGQIKRRPGASSDLFAEVTFDKTEGDGWVTALVRRNVVAAGNPAIGDMPFEFKYLVPQADSGVTGGALLPLFGGVVRVSPRLITLSPPVLEVP
jgi:hypothetical protein